MKGALDYLTHVFKEPISGLTHLASAVAALAGVVALVRLAPAQLPARPALLVYGLSLVLMFSASAMLHLIRTSPAREVWLRKLDHSAIYVLIAGTYTPICLIVLEGGWRWGLLLAVWLMALAGIAFKLAYIDLSRWLTVGLYIGMGWLGMVCVPLLLDALPLGAFGWLLAGGLLYTVGAVIYASQRPNLLPGVLGFHEIWHLFVTAASTAHYILMLRYVVPLAGG